MRCPGVAAHSACPAKVPRATAPCAALYGPTDSAESSAGLSRLVAGPRATLQGWGQRLPRGGEGRVPGLLTAACQGVLRAPGPSRSMLLHWLLSSLLAWRPAPTKPSDESTRFLSLHLST